MIIEDDQVKNFKKLGNDKIYILSLILIQRLINNC